MNAIYVMPYVQVVVNAYEKIGLLNENDKIRTGTEVTMAAHNQRVAKYRKMGVEPQKCLLKSLDFKGEF